MGTDRIWGFNLSSVGIIGGIIAQVLFVLAMISVLVSLIAMGGG